jgi:hypothetical protein
MGTFPIVRNSRTQAYAFEIDNAYVTARRAARILQSIPGVANIRLQKRFHRNEYRVEFEYSNRECVMWEPFGDNSRFWVGPRDPYAFDIDITAIEEAFLGYRPSLPMQVLGNLVSLRPFKRRSSKRHPPAGST